MNKRFIFGTVATAITIFVFEWIFHGMYMMHLYEQTKPAWRAFEDMQRFIGFCIVTKLAMAAVITWIFSRHYEARGIQEGVRFGLYIGLLLGIVELRSYMYLPIPFEVPLNWFLGWVIEGVLIGMTLATVYKKVAK
jgi:hypothetical protein